MSAALKQIPVKVKAFGAPRWATFLKYGRVELMPPSPADIPTAIGQAVRLAKGAATFQWRKVTVREATLNAMVTAEVLCWFFVGECIGKRSLVAYQV